MKVAYLASRFRGASNAEIHRNIQIVSFFQPQIAASGAFPLAVHVTEGLQCHDVKQENNGQWWVDATLDVLRRCDCVIVTPGWQTSVGTYGEVEEALNLGMPVFEAAWETPDAFPSTEMPVPAPTREWIQIIELGGTAGDAYVEDYSEYSFADFAAEGSPVAAPRVAVASPTRGPAQFYPGDRVLLSGVSNSWLAGAAGVVKFVNPQPTGARLFNIDVEVNGKVYACRASELSHAEVQ